MKTLVEGMRGMNQFLLKGNGTVYVLGDDDFEKQMAVEINGLRIKFGGKYKLIKTEDEPVLRITLRVKNIDNDINQLSNRTIQAYDAKGIELKECHSEPLKNNLDLDDDIRLLPGAILSKDYYFKCKTPSAAIIIVLISERDNQKKFVPLLLAEDGSALDLTQRRRAAKNKKEEEIIIREFVEQYYGIPETEEGKQEYEEIIQELKGNKV